MINAQSKPQKITKAVIPAAGFGTRFLPWTKAMTKGMLPIVDKPVVQIAVEQLAEAGIKEIYIVISPDSKDKPIFNHFQPNKPLETQLIKAGKEKELKIIKDLESLAKLHYVYQTNKDPYGNGTPIFLAAKYIKDEPFIYMWADEFVLAEPPVLRQILTAYENYGGSFMTTIRATKDEDYKRYGFVAGEKISPGVIKIEEVIEKPGKEKAPSDLATISPFIFQPSIVEAILEARKQLIDNKELYYNDAIKLLLKKEPFYAVEIRNYRYFDTGNKLEYLKTVVEFGLKDKEFGKKFRQFLVDLV